MFLTALCNRLASRSLKILCRREHFSRSQHAQEISLLSWLWSSFASSPTIQSLQTNRQTLMLLCTICYMVLQVTIQFCRCLLYTGSSTDRMWYCDSLSQVTKASDLRVRPRRAPLLYFWSATYPAHIGALNFPITVWFIRMSASPTGMAGWSKDWRCSWIMSRFSCEPWLW